MKLTQQEKNRLEKILKLKQEGDVAVFRYLVDLEDRLDQEIPLIKSALEKIENYEHKLSSKEVDEIAEVVRDKSITRENLKQIASLLTISYEDIASRVFDIIKSKKDRDKEVKDVAVEAAKLIKPQKVNSAAIEKSIFEKVSSYVDTSISNIKPYELDIEDVRNRFEVLQGEDRLSYKAIDGIEELINKEISRISDSYSVISNSNKYLGQLLDVDLSGVTYTNGKYVLGSGGGAVTSVSNSDSSLTISPTTGAVVGSINTAHSNTWTISQVFNEADVTKTPQPPTSAGANFVSNVGGITSDGTWSQFYIYSGYDFGSGLIAYDATGYFLSASEPSDFNTYNVELTWSGGSDSNIVIIYNFLRNEYITVSDTGSYTITGSDSWTAGSPTLSPTSALLSGSPVWVNKSQDYTTSDFGAISFGQDSSYYNLRLKWYYVGTSGQGSLRFENNLGDLKWIDANITGENASFSNSIYGGQISGYVYPTSLGATYVAYGASGGFVTGSSQFTFNSTNTRVLISNFGITAQSQLHLHYSTATAVYQQFTNSSTGSASSDGFRIGISTTGVAEIRQQESSTIDVYTAGSLRSQWAATASPRFITYGGMEAQYNALSSTSTDGLVVSNNTSATAGTPIQRPGRLRFSGHVWDTGAVATRYQDWIIDPVFTSGNPGSQVLAFGSQYNAGGYTYHMNLSSTGRLHIGNSTTVGSASLHVTSSSAEVARFQRNSSNNSAIGFVNSSGSMYAGVSSLGTTWGVATTADIDADGKFYVLSTGSVGIGVASPVSKLHLSAGASTANYLQITNGTTGETSSDGFRIGITTAGVAEIRQKENTNLEFFTNDTKRVVINQAGQIGMLGGLSSITSWGNIQIVGTGNALATTAPILLIRHATNDSATKSAGIVTETRMTNRYLRTWQNAGNNDTSFGNPGLIQWTAWEYDAEAMSSLVTPTEFRGWQYQYYNGSAYIPLLKIQTTGVGIGGGLTSATNPSASLQIDAGTGTASQIRFTAGTTTGQTSTDGFEVGITSSGAAELRLRENLDLSVYTNNSLVATFKASGRVGIGDSAPERILHVKGDQSGGIFTVERTNSSTNASVGTVVIKGTSTGDMADNFGSAFQFAIEDTANTENIIGYIRGYRANGSDTTGSMDFGVYNAGTDKRVLKLYYDGRAGVATGSSDECPAAVGGVIQDFYADAGNSSTSETDLYSYSLPASSMSYEGDKLNASFAGIFVSSATATRQLKAYFGGTLIYDSSALSVSTSSDWNMEILIIRESSTVVRCVVKVNTTTASSAPYCTYTRVTGLTLSNANTLKITGQAAGVGAATNDIVAKLGTVRFESAY